MRRQQQAGQGKGTDLTLCGDVKAMDLCLVDQPENTNKSNQFTTLTTTSSQYIQQQRVSHALMQTARLVNTKLARFHRQSFSFDWILSSKKEKENAILKEGNTEIIFF